MNLFDANFKLVMKLIILKSIKFHFRERIPHIVQAKEKQRRRKNEMKNFLSYQAEE